MQSSRTLSLILGAIAALLLLLLFSCSAGSGDHARSREEGDRAPKGKGPPRRLILGGSKAGDSAAPATDFFVDQALRAALDSIDGVEYVTLNVRDSLADEAQADGQEGIAITELGAKLGVEGVVFTRIERFGSILAAEMRLVEPAEQRILFRDIAWSFIRYRDTAGVMYLGPTLYDLMRQLTGRCYAIRHDAQRPIATEPLIVASLSIPKDPLLDQISVNRGSIATQGVKALAEFARRHFPELVAFDYGSRAALYRTVNVGAVEDYIPPGNQERRAMFNLGVERFVAASVVPVGRDSLTLRVEIRHVLAHGADSLVDAQEARYAIARFQTTTVVDDLVVPLIDLSQVLFEREARRVAHRYDESRTGRRSNP